MRLMIDSFTIIEQKFLLTMLDLVKIDNHLLPIHKSLEKKLKRSIKGKRWTKR